METAEQTHDSLIHNIQEVFAEYGITNAMTFFVDELGNSRRKSIVTNMIGRSLLAPLWCLSNKQSYMSQKNARTLCKILGRDLKAELLDHLHRQWVSNSIQLLAYRKTYKYGYCINQHYINALLNDTKKEGHLDLSRTLQLAQWLWRNIYDDILQSATQQKKTVTDILLQHFVGNDNPLQELKDFLTQEEQDHLQKIVVNDLIKSIQRAGIPRSLFVLMGRERLQHQLAGIHLYRRLYMILGKPVSLLTPQIRQEFLSRREAYPS